MVGEHGVRDGALLSVRAAASFLPSALLVPPNDERLRGLEADPQRRRGRRRAAAERQVLRAGRPRRHWRVGGGGGLGGQQRVRPRLKVGGGSSGLWSLEIGRSTGSVLNSKTGRSLCSRLHYKVRQGQDSRNL